MTTKNIKFNAKQDKLQTRYAMLTFLQFLVPFLMFVFSGFLFIFVSEPLDKYYGEYRANLYHNHAQYAESKIREFHHIPIKFVRQGRGRRINPEIEDTYIIFPENLTDEMREQLGIPTVYGASDTIHADKLILEYFLGKAYVLSWQGKGIYGQSINIDSPPLSHEEKADIYTRKRPLWFNLLWLSIFPPFAYILHSIIIINLIQRYKKRLKTQIENHSPNFFD